MEPRRASTAGALLLAGAAQFVVGLFVAEALYPGYSVADNAVSDLGATCRENVPCVIHQPSSSIFTVNMLVLGATVLAAAYLLYRAGIDRRFAGALLLTGIGVLGAGVVNETSGFHGVFALVAFVGGASASVLAATVEPGPVRYAYAILGGIAWLGLVWQLLGSFVDSAWFGPLGDGGVERVIVYPVLLWLAAFGTVRLAVPGATVSPTVPAVAVPVR